MIGFHIRALALGGWLVAPLPDALAATGADRMTFIAGPAQAEFDLLLLRDAASGEAWALRVRVGRSLLAPWFAVAEGDDELTGRRGTLAEALRDLVELRGGVTTDPTFDEAFQVLRAMPPGGTLAAPYRDVLVGAIEGMIADGDDCRRAFGKVTG